MVYLIPFIFAIAFIIFRAIQVYRDPELQKSSLPDRWKGKTALNPQVLSPISQNGDADIEEFNRFILELLNSMSGVPVSEGLVRGRIEHMKARARKKEEIKTLKLVEEHVDLIARTLTRAGD